MEDDAEAEEIEDTKDVENPTKTKDIEKDEKSNDEIMAPKEAPDYIKNSPIYQSIKSSKEKREIGAGDAPVPVPNLPVNSLPNPETVTSVPTPQKDEKLEITIDDEEKEDTFKLVEITSLIRSRARDLCQIEAREAFATYLLRVQQRFMVESNHASKSNQTTRERSDQIDLVCRFLTRASANLEKPLELNLPPTTSPINHRKKIIGGLLVEFIQRYNGETQNLITAGAMTNSGMCDKKQFEFFLKVWIGQILTVKFLVKFTQNFVVLEITKFCLN